MTGICPNCERPCRPEDLVSNEFAVQHCGCFYEADPSKVRYHFREEASRRKWEAEHLPESHE